MNTTIKNTIFTWLIAVGIVLKLSWNFLLIIGDTLAFTVALILVGIYSIPFVASITGFRSATGKASIGTAIIISSVISVALLYYASDGYSFFAPERCIVAIVPILCTLLAYIIAKLIVYTKGINLLAYGTALTIGIVISMLGIYILGAYNSNMDYFSLPKEWFYSRPQNDITDFDIEVITNPNDTKNGILYLGGTDKTLFTGMIKSYEEKLRIDFTSPQKVNGVAYYIDGMKFGKSGDVLSPEHGTSVDDYYYQGAVPWNYNSLAKDNQSFLLNRAYIETVNHEFFNNSTLLYYRETPVEPDEINTDPMPKVRTVFAEGTKLVIKDIKYRQNGVIASIDIYNMEGSEWYKSNMIFDELGYEKYSIEDWNEQNFIISDFSAYETIKTISKNANPLDETPDKMIYVKEPNKWTYDSLLANVIAVHGLPVTATNFYIIADNRDWKTPKSTETRDFMELIDMSSIAVNILEVDELVNSFQTDVRHLVMRSAEDRKILIDLYYKDGKLLIDEGPYYLDLVKDKPEDTPEDRTKRAELHQKWLTTLNSY